MNKKLYCVKSEKMLYFQFQLEMDGLISHNNMSIETGFFLMYWSDLVLGFPTVSCSG